MGIIVFRGVGHNPDALSAMGSAQGRRWYVFPLCIIPEAGQVCENSAKPSPWLLARATKQPCDVLHDNELGSKVASKSQDLGIKAAACSLTNASASARAAKVLAWESSGDDINASNSIGSKSFCGKFSYVSVTRDVGPVLCKDTTGKLLNFTEGNGFKTASTFKAKRESADARKQIEDAQLIHSSRSHLVSSPHERRKHILARLIEPKDHLASAASLDSAPAFALERACSMFRHSAAQDQRVRPRAPCNGELVVGEVSGVHHSPRSRSCSTLPSAVPSATDSASQSAAIVRMVVMRRSQKQDAPIQPP